MPVTYFNKMASRQSAIQTPGQKNNSAAAQRLTQSLIVPGNSKEGHAPRTEAQAGVSIIKEIIEQVTSDADNTVKATDKKFTEVVAEFRRYEKVRVQDLELEYTMVSKKLTGDKLDKTVKEI